MKVALPLQALGSTILRLGMINKYLIRDKILTYSHIITFLCCGSRPSSLRKLHDSIADPKYEGVKMSRKMLMEMSDVDEEGDLGDGENEAGAGEMDEEDDYDEEVRGGEDWNNGTPSESEDEFEDEEGEEEEEEAEEVVEETEEQSEEESSPEGLQTTPLKRKSREETTANNTLQNTLQKTREEDLRKGKAVLRQLVSIFPWILFVY